MSKMFSRLMTAGALVWSIGCGGGGDAQGSGGNARAVVARYDGSGQAIWAETLDTSGADTAEDVRVDPATGNLIVLGRTSGAFSGFQNAGQFDTYVAVMNGTGNLLSALQFGDERPQHPTRLGLGPNNKIIVAGYDDLFIDVNFLAAYEHGFVAQLSAARLGAQTGAPLPDPAICDWLQALLVGPSGAPGVAADPPSAPLAAAAIAVTTAARTYERVARSGSE